MQELTSLQNVPFDWLNTEPVANVHIDPNRARLLGIDSYAYPYTCKVYYLALNLGNTMKVIKQFLLHSV